VGGAARNKDPGGSFKKRSEIDRRLDSLVGPSGRMKDASKLNIIKVCVCVCVCIKHEGCGCVFTDGLA